MTVGTPTHTPAPNADTTARTILPLKMAEANYVISRDVMCTRSIGISPIAIVCMEGPWHLLFNVRQRMVYMISAEGFAAFIVLCVCVCVCQSMAL